jgi:hypothetical protein
MEFEIKNDVPQHEDEFLELLYRGEAAEIRSRILEEEVPLNDALNLLIISFSNILATLPRKFLP